jgi:hypothetical protein
MPTIVQHVSNVCAQGTRWRATRSVQLRKDQTFKIQKREGKNQSRVAHFHSGNVDRVFSIANRYLTYNIGDALDRNSSARLEHFPDVKAKVSVPNSQTSRV